MVSTARSIQAAFYRSTSWYLAVLYRGRVEVTVLLLSPVACRFRKLVCSPGCRKQTESNHLCRPKAHQLATWTLLDWLLRQGDSTLSHSGYVLEIILALAHRGTLEIRRGACVYAKELLKPQLPYYLGASVILAQSIVSRLSGNIEESDRWLDGWESQKLAPTNPRDHALDGRIKLSGLENMLQRQDWRNEAAVWSWEPGVHPSPLEADTQRRRLQAMARVFQSIGRFDMARESLEESLKLTSVPARDTHVIMSRLADMHCELGSFDHAEALAKAEIAKLGAVPRPSRLLWRLKLALIEAKIGQGDLASATEHLGTLAAIDLYQPADIVDELLQVRALMAKARVSHLALHYSEAIHDWENVLGSTRRFASFKHGQGFTTAIVYLSLTHALLMIRNSQDAKLRLASANAILETEKVDYWIPRAATDWFPKMSTEIQKQTGMVVYRLSSNPSPAFNLLL